MKVEGICYKFILNTSTVFVIRVHDETHIYLSTEVPRYLRLRLVYHFWIFLARSGC